MFSALVSMDQPYAGFAKALLETQRYPDLRDAAGHPIAPYDVTAHSLALLMGVEVKTLTGPISVSGTSRGGTAATPCPKIASRNALYRSHVASMDEGWTRWVLENEGKYQCLGYSSIDDKAVRAGDLNAKYDSIVIPDQSPRALLDGYRKGAMPDELTGGLGTEGVKALREFVEAGGSLVLFNRASNFAIEQFQLPLRDVTAGLKRTEFYGPGSILRTELDTTHPLTKGMPKDSIAWFENSPAFEFTDKNASTRVRIVAWYPHDKDPLLSGWLLGGDLLKGKAALVEVMMGKGRVVLFGFRPQYRAQSLATYPLLFNALRTR
jgi:hypothetical protein